MRPESDAILRVGRLLENGGGSQAEQALTGDEDLAVVIAGKDDGADADAAQARKEVEDQLLTLIARHRVVEDVTGDDYGVHLLGLCCRKQFIQQFPCLVKPVHPGQRAADMPISGMQDSHVVSIPQIPASRPGQKNRAP